MEYRKSVGRSRDVNDNVDDDVYVVASVQSVKMEEGIHLK